MLESLHIKSIPWFNSYYCNFTWETAEERKRNLKIFRMTVYIRFKLNILTTKWLVNFLSKLRNLIPQ